MEKSESTEECDDKFSDEEKRREYEDATTSKVKPSRSADNMNDLQPFDLNSADAVRQAMKAVLGGKVPPPLSQDVNNLVVQNNVKPESRTSKFLPVGHYIPTIRSHDAVSQCRFKHKQAATACKRFVLGNMKKQGKRPKASKKINKERISSMYIGKLSNVVPFKQRWQSETDSDVDSLTHY